MKISFLGAAKTVTGSCYMVETKNSRFLVDCGLFQGHSKENMLNEQPFPFNTSDIDFILITHSHIDHTGRLPKLYLDGYRNEIIGTKATVELCGILLPDCGHIQEFENEWVNRKRNRAGKAPVPPLYTHQDAIDCLELFRSVHYDETVIINKDIKVKFRDAGHVLGSAILEIWITEDGKETKIVFSGDLGNKGIPILRDPTVIDSADYLVIESTYGNRTHKKNENKLERFVDIINETVEKGGNIIIPSFAVGRTQEIIYGLRERREKYGDKLNKLFNIPVYVDSPLAISATEIFRNNPECFDEEARAYIENGDNPLEFPGLQFTKSADESRALNEKKESIIVISASGMCEAGRIKHHLKHNLWRSESTILFVGYQAAGTLGRLLVDGAKKVKIFGEEISVKAKIEILDGFSGHADREGLLEWLGNFKKKPRKVFLVHGEDGVIEEFSQLIEDKLHMETVIPSRGESFKIDAGKIVSHAESYDTSNQYRRLALLEYLETLKEEIDELADIVKADLAKEKTDREVDELKGKLTRVEKAIVNALK